MPLKRRCTRPPPPSHLRNIRAAADGVNSLLIDNLCPECAYGDLDFRKDGIGSVDGRGPLQWSIIPCPSSGLSVTRENGNKEYTKLKVEGGGRPCDGDEVPEGR